MDRREFFLNTAKASGVVLPWWGLLPLTANAQRRLHRRYLFIRTLDGGLVNDMSSWIRPLTLRIQPVFASRVGDSRELAIFAMRRWEPVRTRHSSPGSAIRCLVVNGINTETNSHNDGAIAAATGKLEMGFPALCELHAASTRPGFPAGWMLER